MNLSTKKKKIRFPNTSVCLLLLLRLGDIKNATWVKAKQSVTTAIEILDNKHSQLEPVFNPEDSTEISISHHHRHRRLLLLRLASIRFPLPLLLISDILLYHLGHAIPSIFIWI